MHASVRLDPDRISWRAVDDEIVAVDLASGDIVSLNRAATVLWALLADGTTTSHLADVLVDTFGIDVDTARGDVEAFLTVLTDREMVRHDTTARAR